jgi:signal transduction histidine kinase
MWRKIGALYRAIEDEQCKVLEDPGTLADIAPGFRHKMAARFARLGPLERARLLAFSLKYRGRKLWMRMAQITLVSTLVGLLSSLVFPQVGVGELLVLSNMLGLGLAAWSLAIYLGHGMFGKPIHLIMFLTSSVFVGAVAGTVGIGLEKGFTFLQSIEKNWLVIVAISCATGLIISIPVTLMGAIRNRQYKQYNAQLELDAERDRAARELSESRLRLLHAQIEPHFLFNTLGAVQQLAEKGAPDAARLTASLITFLRASLAEMRSESVTLEADFAMIDAYLQVMKARQGARLDYTLALPEGLSQFTIPSMMLLTLVENAIKHGIEPSLRGGTIDVAAGTDGARVHITVRDTGPGLGSAPGSGDGLANVRARLKLLHGDAASLTIENGAEEGVVAALMLPLNMDKQ